MLRPSPDIETLPTIQKEIMLYSGTEYFEALSEDIDSTKAGDRIGILTMSFEPSEPAVSDIMDRLSEAADRNVDIIFGVDAFSFLVNDRQNSVGPMWLPMPFWQKNYRERMRVLEKLGSKPSASYSIINKPSHYLSNPYAGRSHLKTAVINDEVYIGSRNFHETKRADMVVGFNDPQIADWLYGLTRDISESGKTSKVLNDDGYELRLDPYTRILLDSGAKGKSIILDEAIKLIADADERVIASFQMIPDGKILKQLIAARNRNVDVKPFYNHPSKHGLLIRLQQQIEMVRRQRQHPKDFITHRLADGEPFLHAKAIATERGAIVGSHNFIERGVQYGTPEIALLREDPAFASAVGELILNQAQAN